MTTTTTPQQMSEVARVLALIKMEYEAAQRGLSGPAAVTRHDRIVMAQQRIGEHFQDLTAIVGSETAAIQLFAAATLVDVEVPGKEASRADEA
jgi:hypothetical protein